MLNYIGTVTVNGFPGLEKKEKPIFPEPVYRSLKNSEHHSKWNETNFR